MSILRTYKFLKYFTTFSRSISVAQSKDIHTAILKKNLSISSPSNRFLRQAVAPQAFDIEKQVQKLDSDVRRTGRISLKDLHELINELKITKQMTSTQALMMIRCCGSTLPEESPEVRIKLVQNIWTILENIGVKLDVSHYNALLRVHIENEHHFSPTEFLAELENKGIEANRVTYQRLITVCCQRGDIEGATRILEFMKEKQLPVNESVFNSLINGHFQAGDVESAVGIVSVMKQANVKPSSDTYTVLMCGYAKSGDVNAIKDVFEQAEKEEIEISNRDLLEVFYALTVNNHTDLIDELTEKLKFTPGYNQDAKNTILRLVVQGYDEAAKKILKTMVKITIDGKDIPVGNFIIKQFVKCKRSVDEVLALCKYLKESHANANALLVATEASLQNNDPNTSKELLEILSMEHEVCYHYYWPILVQYGKSKNLPGLMGTLLQMSEVIKQPVSGETLRDFVVPFLPEGELGIVAMRKGGIPINSGAAAMVAYLLGQGKISPAAKLAKQFRANYASVVHIRFTASAFLKTSDLESFMTLVRIIVECAEANERSAADNIILEILRSKINTQIITDVLQGYLDAGIRIGTDTAEEIQNVLDGNKLTPEISSLLTQLTSPDLKLITIERDDVKKLNMRAHETDEESLLRAMHAATLRGEAASGLKRHLLTFYCNNKQLEKAENLYKELEKENYNFVTGMLVLLMDLYIHYEKFPEAMEFYHKIFKDDPSIQIDASKILKLGGIMAKMDKIEDLMQLIERHKVDSDYAVKSFNTNAMGWKLLNTLAEKKNPDMVKQVFDKLIESRLIEANNVTLGPLIKVHLLRDDIQSALAVFEECCQKYRATPWKNEIACRLIQNEDPVSLQKLTDLSTDIHGEINSLYDLVLSFVECGRIRQARKILETPGLRLRNQRINSACERYNSEGKVNYLENLVEATKDLGHIDRSEIYYHLLLSYCKTDDVDKAFGLWTQMQDEDVQPTDEFLSKLASILQKHDRPIPFAVPNTIADTHLEREQKDRESKSAKTDSAVKEFRKIINSRNVEEAVECLSRLNVHELSNGDRSKLLNLLLNNGRIGEATKIFLDWLKQGLKPRAQTVGELVNAVAKMGDLDTLKHIQSVLDNDLLKITSFSNRLAHCMVEAGKADELLSELENRIKSANTEEEIQAARDEFPRGGIFSLLNNSCDYFDRVEEMAKLYREKGIIEPANAMWAYYYSKRNTEKANEMWSLMGPSERILYQPVLHEIRQNNDVALGWELLKLMKSEGVSHSQQAPIIAAIINVEMNAGNLSECDRVLDEEFKNMPIELIGNRTLYKLKNKFESAGIPFKYNIRPRRGITGFTRDSSSSSDSDIDSEKSHNAKGRI